MKPSRTICRLILPFLFAVLLTAAVLIFVFSKGPASDDVAENVLRFDLLAGREEAAQIRAWSENDADFFLFLPSFADTDAVVFMPRHGSKIKINEQSFQRGDRLSALTPGTSYSLRFRESNSKKMTLTIMKSSKLPSLFVETSSHAMELVHTDKEHKEKASIVLFTASGNTDYCGNGLDEIKGRGNATWHQDKRSYHLNLFNDASLLGMYSSRHWILLSNALDQTNLRNKLVNDFAKKTSLPWTPDCRCIDLFVNGTYNGLYLLSEQAEFDEGRINPSDPRNSFLAEIIPSYYVKEHDHFYMTEGGRCFKIVEPDKYKEKVSSSIYHTLQRTEDAILSLTEDSIWPDNLDLDSFVRRYLIDELFLNYDSDVSSSYYYWDASAQKMLAYPIWDYDISSGNPLSKPIVNPEQLFAKKAPYYKKMYSNRIFFSRMIDLYRTEFLPLFEDLMKEELPRLESHVEQSAAMNAIRWSDMYRKINGGEESDTDNLAELHQFLQKRDAFLKTAWIDMKEYVSVQIHGNDGNVLNVFTIEAGAKADSIPLPSFFGISDSNQWYLSGTDTPLNPDTLLKDNLILFPSPHSVRKGISILNDIVSESLKKPNRPFDYFARGIVDYGTIVIPLFCLLLFLTAMSLYALLNGKNSGGRRK